ncbi:MAG: hypothetical protein KI785_14935 [Devosiaceae bacterium]|nr:hypothetical protein [Devosiaceae bacterium MH13]
MDQVTTARERDDEALETAIAMAALDPARWDDVLELLLVQMPGIRPHLLHHDLQVGSYGGLLTKGYDPDYVSLFHAHYHAYNHWAPAFATCDVGVALSFDQLCAREISEHSVYYHEWLVPQERINAGGGMVVLRDRDRMIGFGANVREVDRETLEPQFLNRVDSFAGRITQAFEINRTLAGLKLEKHVAAVTGSSSAWVFLVRRDGRLLFANKPAERALASGEVITVGLRNRLELVEPEDQAWMAAYLRPCQREGVPGNRQLTPSPFARGERLMARLLPFLPDLAEGAPVDLLFGNTDPMCILTITPAEGPEVSTRAIALRHGLSEAESDIAVMMTQGLSLREIADNRDVSVHTVRVQLKAAMRKFGVHRQAELVARIAALR